jgi:prophage regulatory protein
MSERILRRREVEGRVGLSRSTIYERIAQGEFPRPIRLGKRAVGWHESAIAAWLSARPCAGSFVSSEQGRSRQC